MTKHYPDGDYLDLLLTMWDNPSLLPQDSKARAYLADLYIHRQTDKAVAVLRQYNESGTFPADIAAMSRRRFLGRMARTAAGLGLLGAAAGSALYTAQANAAAEATGMDSQGPQAIQDYMDDVRIMGPDAAMEKADAATNAAKNEVSNAFIVTGSLAALAAVVLKGNRSEQQAEEKDYMETLRRFCQQFERDFNTALARGQTPQR